METLHHLVTLGAEAGSETAKEVSVGDMFLPIPEGMHPAVFILLIMLIGTAIIATIVTMKVRSKRRAKQA